MNEKYQFKVGDTVKIIASKETLADHSIRINEAGASGEVIRINLGQILSIFVKTKNNKWYLKPEDLELIHSAKESPNGASTEIRKFETGATRDTSAGKLSYVKALSPIVLRRYLQYLDKHRLQPDGSMRDFDDWKKGIPPEIYLDSNFRHVMADWLLSEGYFVEDNHGPVDLEDSLCAQLFNTQGRLHEILKKKLHGQEEIQ